MAYGEFTYSVKGIPVTGHWRRQSGHKLAHLYPSYALSKMLEDHSLRETIKPLCGARANNGKTGWLPAAISNGQPINSGLPGGQISACYKCRREAGLLPPHSRG